MGPRQPVRRCTTKHNEENLLVFVHYSTVVLFTCHAGCQGLYKK